MSFTGRFSGSRQRGGDGAPRLGPGGASPRATTSSSRTFEDLRPDSDDAVLLAQTRLVHEWRRFPFLDPRLPSELLPPGWIGARARELFAARHSEWDRAAQSRLARADRLSGGGAQIRRQRASQNE